MTTAKGPATETPIGAVTGITAYAGGSLWISSAGNLLRVTGTTLAPVAEDVGTATTVSAGDDGIYIVDQPKRVIRRLISAEMSPAGEARSPTTSSITSSARCKACFRTSATSPNSSRNSSPANKVVYIQRRQSVLNLLDAAIFATQNLAADQKADMAQWATIAAVAAGTTLGAFVTGIGLAAAVVLDADGTITQGLVPGKVTKNALNGFEIEGRTTADICAKITIAISALERDAYQQKEQVANALRNVTQAPERLRRPAVLSNASGPFSVGTPALAGASTAELTRNMRPKR